MNTRDIILPAVAAAGLVSGCCSTQPIADQKEITLGNALVSVTQGLNAMRESGAGNQPFGLFPSEVEVTFNISASRDNAGELKLDLSAPGVSPSAATAGGSLGYHVTAARGNQITVKFSNLMLADPKNTLVGQQGANVVELINDLKQKGPVASER